MQRSYSPHLHVPAEEMKSQSQRTGPCNLRRMFGGGLQACCARVCCISVIQSRANLERLLRSGRAARLPSTAGRQLRMHAYLGLKGCSRYPQWATHASSPGQARECVQTGVEYRVRSNHQQWRVDHNGPACVAMQMVPIYDTVRLSLCCVSVHVDGPRTCPWPLRPLTCRGCAKWGQEPQATPAPSTKW